MAMMAITTNNSISVKPRRRRIASPPEYGNTDRRDSRRYIRVDITAAAALVNRLEAKSVLGG
jgi:hypothetical protein